MSRPLPKDEKILEGKPFAILAYLSILCIIPLIYKKDNEFALKHAKQGLIIFVAWVAFFVLQTILGPWLLKLGTFVCGVYSLIGIVYAIKGEYVKLTFVSEIAENITI